MGLFVYLKSASSSARVRGPLAGNDIAQMEDEVHRLAPSPDLCPECFTNVRLVQFYRLAGLPQPQVEYFDEH